jgi:hypothetical protein
MSKYLENIAEALIDVLNGAAQSRDHRLVGYAANVDFWVGEIQHCIDALDGFALRQQRFEAAVSRAVKDIREAETRQSRPVDPTKLYYGEATSSIQSAHYEDQVAELRTRLVEAANKFVGRLRNEKLVAPERWSSINERLSCLRTATSSAPRA